jgi:hypothetical protein
VGIPSPDVLACHGLFFWAIVMLLSQSEKHLTELNRQISHFSVQLVGQFSAEK